jgi:uncharacterized membrane protein
MVRPNSAIIVVPEAGAVMPREMPAHYYSRYAYATTLIAYGGLVVALPLWLAWLTPPPGVGGWLAWVLLVPLAFPLPGLIRARPYTFAWTSLMSLFYLCIALMEVMATGGRNMAPCPTLAARLFLFLGCLCFVRLRKR